MKSEAKLYYESEKRQKVATKTADTRASGLSNEVSFLRIWDGRDISSSIMFSPTRRKLKWNQAKKQINLVGDLEHLVLHTGYISLY